MSHRNPQTKCKYCKDVLDPQDKKKGFHKDCYDEYISFNKSKLLFKFNPNPRPIGAFPKNLIRPKNDEVKLIPLQIPQETPQENSSGKVFQVGEIAKDMAMMVLPWRQREAVKVGWKITKFISGKK